MKKLFALLLAAIMLFTAGCSTQSNTEDISIQYTFPGEWEEHEGTWLIWPHNYGVIEPEYVDMINETWVTMTDALHTGEKVHIIAYSEDEQARITKLLTDVGVDMAQVDFMIAESDQFWARDYGPLFVYNTEGALAILDAGYNGYGRMDKLAPEVPEKDRWEMPEFVREEYLENYTKDDILASAVAKKLDIACVDINDFVLEGGAIESDGCGTIITNESCILNENRNPGLTKAEAEKYFKEYLGITNVI